MDLGDLISQLPAIKFILENHQQHLYNLWVHDYGTPICKKLFGHYPNVKIRGVGQNKKEYNDKLPARSPYAHKVGNLASHLTEHAFYTLLGRSVEDQYKNYLQLDPIDVSHFNLPEKYVCITTGFTSKTRQWLDEYVNGVVDYVLGEGYTPVFLGKSYVQSTETVAIKGKFTADYSKGVNLIDKTNLFEAHSIMTKSSCVVGLDNGLLHLSCMSNVPSVWGFTTVDPNHRLPYRENTLGWNTYTVTPDSKTLACTFCQSNMSFASHDFTDCFYKDFKCLQELTIEKWIEQLDKIL